MNKKGFTLIELLAVIVILAIIALIATPIVLNIIEDSKKSAFLQTGNGIVDAAEYYYMKEMSDGAKPTENKVFTFNGSTTGLEGLEFDGEIPKEGSVIINTEGDVAIAMSNNRYCITKGYKEVNVTITENVENCEIPVELESIMTSENSCIQTGNTCSADDIKSGIIVNVKVNNVQTEQFYVLADDGNKLTLILNRNIGNNVEWYENVSNNSYGPITALTHLQLQTSTWTNLPEIIIDSFEYDDGMKLYYKQSFTMYARLPKNSEIYAINNSSDITDTPWLYANLSNEEGYWTSTANSKSTEFIYCVYRISGPNTFGSYGINLGYSPSYGVRPVIELIK